MTDDWTPEMRAAWDETWQLPHMQRGLAELKERMRKKSSAPMAVAPGYDALVLAASVGFKTQGQSEVFEAITDMRREQKSIKHIDKPEFTAPENWGK